MKVPHSEVIEKCSGRGDALCSTCNPNLEPCYYKENQMASCPTVHGRGLIAHRDGSDTICIKCSGKEKIPCATCGSHGLIKCESCRGSGSILAHNIAIVKMKPIVPVELYRDVRDSQLIGVSGYSREGLPVFAIGAGLSTFDKASVHYYIQSHIQINEYRDRIVLPSATKTHGRHISKCVKVLDMTGLKLSALSQIKLLTIISNIDDLNYPEKTQTYYIVNAPYVFSACWKVVKPLLQERTRKKVQVLSGCGQEELLKIMDYDALPHFCRKQGSGSSKYSTEGCMNCFSLDHPFHQELYDYIKRQAALLEPAEPIKQRSFHVDFPETEESVEEEIVQTIEFELHKLGVSQSGDGSGSSDD